MGEQQTEARLDRRQPGLGGNRTVVMLVCLIYYAGINLPGLSLTIDSNVETL